jgi:tetratricopeptide (TPR) repeat protein
MTLQRFWIVLVIAVAMLCVLVSGCRDMFNDASADANDNWRHARASSAYEVAKEKLALGDLSEARYKIEEAVHLDPHHLEARILLAKVDIEQGRYKAALDGLKEIQTWMPDNEEVIFLQAVAYEKSGNLEWAFNDYLRAYELDSREFGAILAATEVLVLQEKVAAAAAFLNDRLPMADNDPAAYELAGRLAMMLGDYELAADYYQWAWDNEPNNTDYQESMAIALVYADKPERAIEALQTVAGRYDETAPSWVHAMLGDSYLMAGKLAEAIQEYEALCELEPDAAQSWLSLAKAHAVQGNYAIAADACRRAVRLDGRSVEARTFLGYTLLKDGRHDEAIKLLASTASRYPNDATLQCVLGRAYAVAGKSDLAQACFSQAVEIEPESQLAWRLLDETTAMR